ncbi:MAG: RluA family pseudouridine synthase [Myxococcota bacterium]|nr:RluA family pseudouridine synthase [Myxococcota bacterium]MDW8363583.1 RluA family pseudouridine synthase [Myxococcales bacterium]
MNVQSEARIVFVDDDLLVVDKPPGLPTTAPDGRPCLVGLLRARMERGRLLHPSSRLDAGVSGLVAFACTRRAIHALLRARRRGQYARRYVAIASRAPRPEQGSWRWAVGIDPRRADRRVAVQDGAAGRAARPAETRYRLRQSSAAGPAWLELEPVTGRTHQLRVHAAAAGCPLLGDILYGGPRRVVLADGSVVSARRPMLHCAVVELPHPRTGAPVRLHAPPPADMAEAWGRLAAGPCASVDADDTGDEVRRPAMPNRATRTP